MESSNFVDTCIVGGGVVGLAIARLLARSGLDVLVIEKGPRFGEGVSARNSEVIHAGIYYPKNSLKALLCVRGREMLYDYCAANHVGYQKIGKLIVATDSEEEAQLEGIRQRAADNGVDDLDYLGTKELNAMEPALQATAALLSPSTGIISAHDLMTAFLGEAEACGAVLAVNAEVQSVHVEAGGFHLLCDIEGEDYALACRQLVNAAGLGAHQVAQSVDGLDPQFVPPGYLCKGSYFVYQGKSPFQRLIYPVPDPSGAGLGVHATIDLGGQVKFGPDVEYIGTENYVVTAERLAAGSEAIRRYFPSLEADRLVPGYAGIRPKLQGPGEPPADFMIQCEQTHSISGLINLFGIESPGLTSSMAIAETVAQRLGVPGF